MEAERHRSLVKTIQNVHRNLRKQYQENGSEQLAEIWDCHLSDWEKLNEYANAMHQLANTFWKNNNEKTRIDWCNEFCLEYFHENKYSAKFLKRIAGFCCHCNPIELKDYRENHERKIRLLDVGSCYNPFSEFSHFSTIAVDLHPATDNVFSCDFLKINISSSPDDELDLKPGITHLPKSYFDVVVFCLLLEYLPSRAQRWKCCLKARELVRCSGLLLIVSPDSKNRNYNADMIRSWTQALRGVDFVRLKYDKFTHLHCLAFAKETCRDLRSESEASDLEEMMFIPQDFQDHCAESKNCSNILPRGPEDDERLCRDFSELPFPFLG